MSKEGERKVNFLHWESRTEPRDVFIVTLDKQANVRLLDGPNFTQYKAGQKYSYYGGKATVTPVRLKPPAPGNWHVVVDLGGYAGTVRATVLVMPEDAADRHLTLNPPMGLPELPDQSRAIPPGLPGGRGPGGQR